MMTLATMKNYRVVVQKEGVKIPIVALACKRQHHDGAAWAGITAFDMDGNQTGLSLADLYEQAENHETEEH